MDAGAAGIHVCKSCRHYRERPKIDLFEGADFNTAAALKAQTEFDQETKQRAEQELERFRARQPFDYEPFSYAWCGHFTKVELVEKAQAGDQAALDEVMSSGGATMNPVSGELTALYLLCAWMNPTGQCPAFEAPAEAP